MIKLSYLDGLNDVEIYSALRSYFILLSIIQSNDSIVKKSKIIYHSVFYNRQQNNERLFSSTR